MWGEEKRKTELGRGERSGRPMFTLVWLSETGKRRSSPRGMPEPVERRGGWAGKKGGGEVVLS